VRVELTDVLRPCERLAADGSPNAASVNLAPDPQSADSVLATLCFHGVTATASGPRTDPARFAVIAAEALNGLRAEPAASARPSPAPLAKVRPVEASSALAPGDTFQLSLAETLLLDPLGFPPLLGSSLDAELSLNARAALLIEGFFPVSRAELSGSQADFHVGFAFARLGLALRQTVGAFALSGAFTAGPAFMWVKATAKPPRLGGDASALSAIGSVGLRLCYPGHGRFFTFAQSRATLLFPAGRFNLPNDPSPTLGPLLIEASLGVGARL
jgi:hypothetical protein